MGFSYEEIKNFKPCAVYGTFGEEAQDLTSHVAGHYGVPTLLREDGVQSGVAMVAKRNDGTFKFPTAFYVDEFMASPKNLHTIIVHLLIYCERMGWKRMALLLRPSASAQIREAELEYVSLGKRNGIHLKFFYIDKHEQEQQGMQVLEELARGRYSIIFDWLRFAVEFYGIDEGATMRQHVLSFYSKASELGLTQKGTNWIFHENSPSNYHIYDEEKWSKDDLPMAKRLGDVFAHASRTFAGTAISGVQKGENNAVTLASDSTPGTFWAVANTLAGRGFGDSWKETRTKIQEGLTDWPGNRRWHVEQSPKYNFVNLTFTGNKGWEDSVTSGVFSKLFLVAKQIAQDGLCELQVHNYSHQRAVMRSMMSIDAVTPDNDRLIFECASKNGTILKGASALEACDSQPVAASHFGLFKINQHYPDHVNNPFNLGILRAYIGGIKEEKDVDVIFPNNGKPVYVEGAFEEAARRSGENLENYTKKYRDRWAWMGLAHEAPKDYVPDSCGPRQASS